MPHKVSVGPGAVGCPAVRARGAEPSCRRVNVLYGPLWGCGVGRGLWGTLWAAGCYAVPPKHLNSPHSQAEGLP